MIDQARFCLTRLLGMCMYMCSMQFNYLNGVCILQSEVNDVLAIETYIFKIMEHMNLKKKVMIKTKLSKFAIALLIRGFYAK